MLRAFRNSTDSILAKIILALLIASFAVWGIGDMVISRPGQAEVARIGDVIISRQAVENEMQRDVEQIRQRMGAEYKPELLRLLNIPEQVATRMVTEEVIRQASNDLGLIASDEIVSGLIRSDNNFHNNGEFDKKMFLRVLRQNGLSERDFVAMMRQDIARRLMGQAVSGIYTVPDITVRVMQAAKNEKRDVTIYQINQNDIDIQDPTDEELTAYYQSVSDRYAIPEYRTISYTTISGDDVAGEANASEEELKALYEERLNEYQLPETRDIELLLYTGKEDAEKAGAMLKEGKSSKAVAKEMPPVNATNTVMDKVTPSRLPEELQSIVFELEENQVSEPIASGFGFHVVKISKVNPSTTKPFADVKKSLENELKSTRAGSLLTQKADALEDILAGGSTLNEAAKELGLKVKSVGPFSRTGKTPTGGQVTPPSLNNFVPLAFSVEEGESSSIALGKPGIYYLVQADKVVAEQLPPIAEVKGELVTSWKTSKRDTLKLQHARDIASKLTDINKRDEFVASGDVKKLGAGSINRDALKVGATTLPAQMVQEIFAAKVGAATSASKLSNGRYIVASVESSTMPPLTNDLESEEAKQILANIQANQQQELMTQLMAYLKKKYSVSLNRDVLQQIGTDDS